MSQLALQSREGLPGSRQPRHMPAEPSTQDSPTTGRTQNHQGYTNGPTPSSPLSIASSSTSSRSLRKPARSPLHASTAASASPPTSPSSSHSDFPVTSHDSYATGTLPQIITTSLSDDGASEAVGTTYYDSDSSDGGTPTVEDKIPIPVVSPPNDSPRTADFPVTSMPAGGPSPSLPQAGFPTMAGTSGSQDAAAMAAQNPPRKSSLDSVVSAMSVSSNGNRPSADGTAAMPDVASLIKTAGSPEAVIQYLLKEKNSQSQQNAQLWRLVDKQRAMILGLNKDLERALKDKEKYRKKLKEVVMATEGPSAAATSSQAAPQDGKNALEVDVSSASKAPAAIDISVSPVQDSDDQKNSPINVPLAPYPITPPADRPIVEAPSSGVAEMLDPSHAMPRASEHAFHHYDPDAQEREAEMARKEADQAKDLPLSVGLPPSRSLPSEPPRIPPPQVPATSSTAAAAAAAPAVDYPPTVSDESITQFPAPPAQPPRKPPPTPLQIRNAAQTAALAAEEDPETESDYDDILEVDEIAIDEQRGRRRTREEDDREREIMVLKEVEARSLSKKSKKSSSQKGAPKSPQPTVGGSNDHPPGPKFDQGVGHQSLDGVLNNTTTLEVPWPAHGGLKSPGLPSSPRPMMGGKTPVNSPPMSPPGVPNHYAGQPLSPRPPRQPIPLPPNTPLQTPSHDMKSPRPLQVVKQASASADVPSPTSSSARESPTERTKVFKGLMTDEYPDFLLPPNALPSIDIKVASSRMKPSRASLISLTQLEEDPVFTLAIFSRADGGELWRVEKDTASLVKLDQRLKQCPAFTARTPDRSLFTGHAPAKLDARRIALNQYLDEMLNTPFDTDTAVELCKYLSHNTLPPNSDQTGSAQNEGGKDAPSRTGPGGRPFRTGYLTKRGKNFGGWKARFFVLDGPHLKYYETPGGAHLGTIKLQKAQIGKQSPPTNEGAPGTPTATDDVDNQYRHAFLILEPKKRDPTNVTKHVLCAESDSERDQWVDALLRWIDFTEPGDEDHKEAHDKRDSAGAERANGKKKGHGHKHPQHHPTESEDTLIGMSYDAARPGDTPQGAPAKSKHGHHETESVDSTQNHSTLSISGPRDPQVISNSDAWGSKLSMALAPPNVEEKKARKRSFFGFGPKARSSSDGQDSTSGNDSTTTLVSKLNHPRQVFGATLAEAVRYNSPVDVRIPLPAVVYRCIQYLDSKNAISEEGIFRLSGSNVIIRQLRERFNNESDVNLVEDEQYYDIHAVASLLKLYLRELPTTILTRELHLEFVTATEMTDLKEKLATLGELVERLPQANATLLKYLISFLIRIINHSHVNKMTVRNVGIVFSPTLNIPAPVFAMFLQHYESIFGIDPEEYELPSPVSDIQTVSDTTERRPSLPFAERSYERRPSDPVRPSTAGASSSPHRQRLMEAAQANRSTPTPPPMSMQQMAQMNAMRSASTPTPPPQRQPNHDPHFFAQQQQGGSHVATRPPYEPNLGVPNGAEPVNVPAPAPRPTPGYDRPIYENGLSVEQPSSYKNRRESTMFMGNLNHQVSKSRLREETY